MKGGHRVDDDTRRCPQLATLLRNSDDLDIVGDVTATVASPSDLLAWAHTVPEPAICAWRAGNSGHRYVQVTARCHRAPVHGWVTAILAADEHHPFWDALLPDGELAAGDEQLLPLSALVTAWSSTVP